MRSGTRSVSEMLSTTRSLLFVERVWTTENSSHRKDSCTREIDGGGVSELDYDTWMVGGRSTGYQIKSTRVHEGDSGKGLIRTTRFMLRCWRVRLGASPTRRQTYGPPTKGTLHFCLGVPTPCMASLSQCCTLVPRVCRLGDSPNHLHPFYGFSHMRRNPCNHPTNYRRLRSHIRRQRRPDRLPPFVPSLTRLRHRSLSRTRVGPPQLR